jgi:transposase-like protein
MRKVPPSDVLREEINRSLADGVQDGTDLLSHLAHLGLGYLVQQALEQEQEDFLGRGRYERRGEGIGDRPPRYRNGYEEGKLKTAEGEVRVRVPQVRGTSSSPYRSRLMEFLGGNSEALERLVVEMYARGLSTRDVEECFRDEISGELMISRSAVSEITERLWEDYREFSDRDLSGIEVEYLFLDAVYESLRRYGAKEGILAAWCITTEGRKVLLHLAVGNKESEACWTEFLRDMVGRGLRIPTSVTSDGAPGLVNAIEGVFSKSLRIRCWYHKMSNIRSKLPEEGAETRGKRSSVTRAATFTGDSGLDRKAVPSSAPEINSNHVVTKTAPMTKGFSSSVISSSKANPISSYSSGQYQCAIPRLTRNTTTVVPIAVMSPTYWKRAKTNLLPSLMPP